MRRLLAEAAFGEVDDEHPAAVHEGRDVDRALRLADDVAQRRRRENRADLVEDRRDRFRLEALVVALVFDFPIAPDDRIGAGF